MLSFLEQTLVTWHVKMADNTNPFMEEDDFIENAMEQDDGDPGESLVSPVSIPEGESFASIDHIAARLIKDNFLLTALELHTELVETGRELPRLRDFFSNPTNFEKTRTAEASSPGLRKFQLMTRLI